MNNAQSLDDYCKVITTFGNIDSNYQDINEQIKGKIAECERKKTDVEAAEEAAHRRRVQDAFNSACKIMSNVQSLDDYRKAIATFESIDTNYQDINGKIKGKIAECESKMQQIEAELDKALASLREKFGPKAIAEKQAKLQEQRKADKEHIDTENAKTKADIEAKCSQIRQKFDADHQAWQEEYNRLKAAYNTEYKKWETETSAIKEQVEIRKSQGLCPHCGGTLKGLLLLKKCTACGKSPKEPIKTPPVPVQPNYPAEPKMPPIPVFTPMMLDESKYAFVDDTNFPINQHITFSGIEWRILDAQRGQLLLISEKIIEKQKYTDVGNDITWENCTLRKYLNGDFFNKLGTIKHAIAETRNNNTNNPWYGTAGRNATTDKVFLFNLDELVYYFGDSGDLRNMRRKDHKGNDDSNGHFLHDQYNSARMANYRNEGASFWWLRSPGYRNYFAAYVRIDGSVDVNGINVSNDSGGVRPALWLNL